VTTLRDRLVRDLARATATWAAVLAGLSVPAMLWARADPRAHLVPALLLGVGVPWFLLAVRPRCPYCEYRYPPNLAWRLSRLAGPALRYERCPGCRVRLDEPAPAALPAEGAGR
jgi:hypothetical protein